MDAVFKKMNFKNHEQILVLNAPESFNANIASMAGLTHFYTDLTALEKLHFTITFVTEQREIDDLAPKLIAKLEGDALVWFCYPKKSSKKYNCNFNRDTGWEIMGEHGLEPVRIVAVDKDWSALRFRKVNFIKKITRRANMALTKEAKQRTTGRK